MVCAPTTHAVTTSVSDSCEDERRRVAPQGLYDSTTLISVQLNLRYINMRVFQAAVLIAYCTALARARLVAAAVLPHGDFAFDPSLLANPEARAAAYELHRGASLAGDFISEARPDVIVLTTPHGLQANWDLGVYENSALDGEATVGRDLEESYGHPSPSKLYKVRLGARTDVALARAINERLSSTHSNVTLFRGWNGVLPMPLHWGEVLALGFIANATESASNDGATARALTNLPPLVTIGLPLSRYNLSSTVAPGFRAMGHELGALLDASEKRVALVVSTDLAHRHWRNTTFGYSAHAAPFDSAVGRWAARLETDALMRKSLESVDQVYSCGWLGMVLLHGALEATAARGADAALNQSWHPTLTAAPAHPTYYGMLAAHFGRVNDTPQTASPLSVNVGADADAGAGPAASEPRAAVTPQTSAPRVGGGGAALAVAASTPLPCPIGNHRCHRGCTPVEAGNATCCDDGTACGEGYRCGLRHGFGMACLAVHVAVAVRESAAPAADDRAGPALAGDAAKPDPMGTAGWELRYHLCDPGAFPLYHLQLPPSAASQGRATLRFPYYSNGGPIDSPSAAQAEMAFVVQHGAGRNADDYFCSGVQAAAMAGYGGGRALVIAPRFMEPPDRPPNLTLFWNGSYPEGCWRCGAESDPRASSDGVTTISSFAVLDEIVRALQRAAANGALPRLSRVAIAGHSSGGQIIQRHAIFTRLPPRAPRPLHSRASSAVAQATPLEVRHVPANPSSYAYLSPRRWRGLMVGPDQLVVPDAATRARCPDYDSWHFGLSGRLPPYVRTSPGGVPAAVARFALRDVRYLQGHNDTCDCNSVSTASGGLLDAPDDSVGSSPIGRARGSGGGAGRLKGRRGGSGACTCISHGLETTCADELMGRYRLARGRLYYAHLQVHFNASAVRPVHVMHEVNNVGHDHTQMWQSAVGLEAIFSATRE